MEGQRYTKRLNERQITALLKVTCQRPRDREHDILQVRMILQSCMLYKKYPHSVFGQTLHYLIYDLCLFITQGRNERNFKIHCYCSIAIKNWSVTTIIPTSFWWLMNKRICRFPIAHNLWDSVQSCYNILYMSKIPFIVWKSSSYEGEIDANTELYT